MSIQSLRASLELLNTNPGAQSSFNTPSRSIYHQTARDVMLIQGIHYAVEEALATVGELESSDPLLDPGRRCLLRLQQTLIDIARISENIQESTLRNIINHASTSQAPIEETPTPQPLVEDYGRVPPSTAPVPVHPCIEDSDEPTISLSSSSEIIVYKVTPDCDRRTKRERPKDDDHTLQPPAAKRSRFSPNGSIYPRPTYQQQERTSVLGWARWIFMAPRQ